MKPQTLHGEAAKISGNMDIGTTITMDISIEDRAHLMSMLSNLYSDRVLACIREYSTNARDAHIMSGQPEKPIQVTLPTPLSQFFKIRDFGDGLDIAGLTKYYARYGASAKRDSDDTNGTLGVGCKAALTYSPTFSIVSVKDGVKYSVAVTLNEDNIGELSVISETKTTEPSGVEVSIPVKRNDFWDFEQKAKGFYRWWKPEHYTGISVNPLVPISDLGDGLFTYARSEVAHDLVIMGGVAYPIPYEGGLLPLDNERSREYSIVYFAQMGEVVFAPSREALMTVGKTKKAIDGIRERIRKNIEKSVSKDVEKAETGLAAMVAAATFRETYAGIDLEFKYKGEDVPVPGGPLFACRSKVAPVLDDQGKQVVDMFGNPKVSTTQYPFHVVVPRERSTESRRHNMTEGYSGWNRRTLNTFADVNLIVMNAPVTVTPAHRKVIREYHALTQPGHDKQYFFVPGDEIPGEKWLGNLVKLEWDGIKKVVRDSNKTTLAISDRTKYEVRDRNKDGTTKWEKRQVADAEKVLVTSSTFATNNAVSISNIVSDWDSKLKFDAIVVMPVNRWDKFMREHKNARFLHHEVAKHWQVCYDGMSKALRDDYDIREYATNTSRYNVQYFTSLDPKGINDPDLAAFIKAMSNKDAEKMKNEIDAGVQYYQHYFNRGMSDGIRAHKERPVTMDIKKRATSDKVKRIVASYKFYDERVAKNKPGIMTEVINAIYKYTNGKV